MTSFVGLKRSSCVAAILALGLSAAALAQGAAWYPVTVEVWDPPFDMSSPRKAVDYSPLEKASQKWNICVSVPHLKDEYWVAVDYGVSEEARRPLAGQQQRHLLRLLGLRHRHGSQGVADLWEVGCRRRGREQCESHRSAQQGAAASRCIT